MIISYTTGRSCLIKGRLEQYTALNTRNFGAKVKFMAIPIPIIGSIISGITGFFSKKQEIKKASITAKAKLETLKETGAQTLELTDAEWESLSVQTQNESWKDEYITLIITSPFITILVGSIGAALGFDWGTQIVSGTVEGLKQMTNLGMDYGIIINAVVFAAVGLKLWRA